MGGAGSYSASSRPRPPVIRKRENEMQVICLGLPRTGTASLCEALKQLGYKHPYHFRTLFGTRRSDAARWRKLLDHKYRRNIVLKSELDDVLFNCMAVSDIPALLFHEELLRAYPFAKVILTVRESAEEWADSYKDTVIKSFREIFEPKNFVSRMRSRLVKSDMELLCAEVQHRFLDQIEQNPEKFYNEWVASMKRRIHADRLLVYKVSEGWEPLTRFLGPMFDGWPLHSEFPHLNARENFPQMFLDDSASTITANSTSTSGKSSIMSGSTLVGSTRTTRTARTLRRER